MRALVDVDRAEVYRYLGVKGQPDDATRRLAEQAIRQLAPAATPRFVKRTTALTLDGDTVKLDDYAIKSANLASHLRGCEEAVLFAATLGSEVDRLLSKNGLLHPATALAEQAAAAAMIEQYCDDCCADMAAALLESERFLRPRFSPGYGDFPLACQKALLDLLDAPRRIGLSLTDTLLLTPMKSVTAVIGVTTEKQSCHTGHCAGCSNVFCVFRKE